MVLTQNAKKYVLYCFNVLIMISGIVLMTLGGIMEMHLKKLQGYKVAEVSVGGFSIGLGFVICVIATYGCFAAVTKNRFLINGYAIVLLCLFILQSTLAMISILSLHNNEKITANISVALDAIWNSNDHEDINDIQAEFKCCKITTKDMQESLPKSCYEDPADKRTVYRDNCNKTVRNSFLRLFSTLAATATLFGIAELLCAIFAFLITHSKKLLI